MNHNRMRARVHDARKDVTRALAELSYDRDALDPLDVDAEAANDQVWVALCDAHKYLTTALAFVNADANRQAAQR